MSTPERPQQGTRSGRRATGARRVQGGSKLARALMSPVGKAFLVLALVTVVSGAGVFIYYYQKYAKLIDDRLKGGPFQSTSRIYGAPEVIDVGDITSPGDIATELRAAGYSDNSRNTMGYYVVKEDSIDVFPGAESYFRQEPAAVKFARGKISRIISLRDNTDRPEYDLEPQLVTNLHSANREKQRLVRYDDIPVILREAILSAEDKRFFSHPGFDIPGIVRAAWIDLKNGRNEQGASTLTMQLARYMFLTLSRTWQRKAAEIMITLQLEQKLTKEQIFELYCNQVDLGHRGSFMIRGFGEAAQAYFGKDIKFLNVQESATLAAMLKSASYYSPWRFPERAKERRNTVLALMRENKYIDDRTYALAVESPLKVQIGQAESKEAPYFVDLVNEDLEKRFPGTNFQRESARIYTTLDLDLQKFANEAVSIGMKQVDEIARKQARFRKAPYVEPQVALIALDPHTGEIKALVGGRNYGVSQLNHVNAERQPGSIFKPFVYATAINTALTGGETPLTQASIVRDEPTTFTVDGQPPYEPHNFEHEFYGDITYRTALAKSINVATIKIAELVGYDKVVDLAHRAGINEEVKATPAMAIGSYDATPLEMAGAYTVFANQGVRVQPTFITRVNQPDGKLMLDQKPEKKDVLDPRVTGVLVDMLQEVMRSGTAGSIRGKAYNFSVPAAGKTGTSHDGWFAGFTSDLLCIVWVGFDDNRELDIEGAKSALPVWGEFMKRAITLRRYANARPFEAPDGTVYASVDDLSGGRATPLCPPKEVSDELFIAGTEPVAYCPLHGGKGGTTVSAWESAPPALASPAEPAPPSQPYITGLTPRTGAAPKPSAKIAEPVLPPAPAQKNTKSKEKKGFFDRLKGIFH
ncbi:MAG TPA: PBP1A family penicillin-binding protein [Bryobacteraceae bacterium]|nr:PBP1A family penicillin-binding protein [Bryobacteraceae bacterium]